MISTSSLVLDGHHGHGLGPGPGPGPGGPHHMAFVDPYLRSKLPSTVPEFIRPLPKPAPIVPKFNAQRPSPSQSPRKEYQNVPVSSSAGPVNLTSIKHDNDNISDSQISRTSGNMQIPHLAAAAYTSRMFPPPGFPYAGLQTYGSLYPSPYSSLLNRPTYINSTPLSPLERQYSPPQSANGGTNNPAFLPPGSYSNQNTPQAHPPPPPPPPVAKPGQSLLREKKSFKIPPGKDNVNVKQQQQQQQPPRVIPSKPQTKRVTLSSNVNNNNNNLLPPNFTKGSLIQLANGDLRRVEDVTTEELVTSAERCPAFRLDPSTVVRIEENMNGTVLLTLSYGENKKTVSFRIVCFTLQGLKVIDR